MIQFILAFLFASTVYAEELTPSIYLNEIQIEPVQKVEIVNATSSVMDISGWYLDDDGGTTYVTFPEATVLQPASCLIFEGKFNLNKASADTLRLFNDTLPPTSEAAIPIDTYSYDTSPGELLSFQRSPDGSTQWIAGTESFGRWNETLTDCQILPSSTPTLTITINPTPTQIPTPTSISVTNIRISEACVYPESGDNEWVELYNPNNFDITLQNWYIDDAENGGSTPKKFTLTISAKDYEVFELTSVIFNNNSDSVRLLNTNNQIIDSLTYSSSQKGISLGRYDIESNDFCLQEPTKGDKNGDCLSEKTEITETPKVLLQTVFPLSIVSPNDGTPISSKQYVIRAKVPNTQNSEVFGITDHIEPKQNNEENTSILFLPSAYSLLSIISLTVKMKLK